ncbi:ankyrin repeat domain-containing protein SOWAHC-like [Platysternon megacephalum]|uniref:Ankyrin repeat domain-containing protein SOWAHC-like n=1 Tax=Platysternon megacephalum TaxID=55544 RepID=A0A4D9E8H5_9SAUR|nr:ankyrin repeat domain-containing protein SOWAHC-like [Platysternon megacephalum]
MGFFQRCVARSLLQGQRSLCGSTPGSERLKPEAAAPAASSLGPGSRRPYSAAMHKSHPPPRSPSQRRAALKPGGDRVSEWDQLRRDLPSAPDGP